MAIESSPVYYEEVEMAKWVRKEKESECVAGLGWAGCLLAVGCWLLGEGALGGNQAAR